MTVTEATRLAVDGGPKAFAGRTGTAQPKIGVDEFLSIAARFGFSDAAMARLKSAVSNSDLPEGGPNLARYACPNPAPVGPKYEALAREMFGVKHALTVSSGTAALHAAFTAVGAAPGREVIVPATGFFATSAAAALCGATVVFCDVDESLQLDARKLEKLITDRTVAIAPTHHWGGICAMDGVLEIARKHKLRVVEDCAQSPGGKWRGKYVGSMGDIGCFSISAYKIIGGGEGGMVVTSDERLYERLNQFAECGGLWRSNRFAPPRYENELFVGTNYRLSELESAVDIVQLGKLDDVVRRYHDNKLRILRALKTYREVLPQTLNDPAGEVGYMMRFYPQSFELGGKIVNALNAEGIGCWMPGENPVPDWHLYHQMFPLAGQANPNASSAAAAPGQQHPSHHQGACPVADDLYNRCVMIPIDQWYSRADCDAIAAGIDKVLGAYCMEDPSSAKWV